MQVSSLRPLEAGAARRQTIATQAYERIREAIVTTAMKPGTEISETEIAATIGISRTPVREAFIRLAEEGLLDILPQSGTRVSRLKVSRVRESVLVRGIIEGEVIRRAAAPPSPRRVLELEDCIRRQRLSILALDFALMHRHDMEFHQRLMAAYGCPHAWAACEAVAADIARIQFLIGMDVRHVQDVIREHEAILSAVRTGDQPAAAAAVERHIANAAIDRSTLEGKDPSWFDEDGTDAFG
jgi:DNA-binding GntR family transcriptional regulator